MLPVKRRSSKCKQAKRQRKLPNDMPCDFKNFNRIYQFNGYEAEVIFIDVVNEDLSVIFTGSAFFTGMGSLVEIFQVGIRI